MLSHRAVLYALNFDLSKALLVFGANHEGEIQPFRNEGI